MELIQLELSLGPSRKPHQCCHICKIIALQISNTLPPLRYILPQFFLFTEESHEKRFFLTRDKQLSSFQQVFTDADDIPVPYLSHMH
jgi:hypothetical protein